MIEPQEGQGQTQFTSKDIAYAEQRMAEATNEGTRESWERIVRMLQRRQENGRLG